MTNQILDSMTLKELRVAFDVAMQRNELVQAIRIVRKMDDLLANALQIMVITNQDMEKISTADYSK